MRTERDLFITREYSHKDITVVVNIDLANGKISLCDRNGGPKKWVFADRQLAYMRGWQNILDAMKYAVAEATKVLEAESETQLKEVAARVNMVNNIVDESMRVR